MQFRHQRRPLDGVLLLDKPCGMTSNGALQAARRVLNAAKAGHTGTLDPLASGLLPLTFGEATKFSQMLLDADKTYEARLRLGAETDTGDAEGSVTAQAAVTVDRAALEAVLERFRGAIEQVPPIFSALKRDGRPLYEYARAGIDVELEARPVVIHELSLEGFDGEFVDLRVSCSKGTYIRSLAVDIGRALGCGAHLAALRRTRIGAFGIAAAVPLAQLQSCPEAERDALLAPVDALVAAFPSAVLDPQQAQALLQGRQLDGIVAPAPGLLRVYAGERFLGLAVLGEDGKLSPKRLIATAASGAAA
ncbi:tRNA pseudouridine(55) synthase TruB [Pseudothauera lacus]|uniref:tRNA pseudouridine synthase B n=1 Tax=Pseudothauera lacus TaxID=2136175 RepID=A0A2T4IK52_9RHOO|nr:tRNA pseudouridine(55) synthase TruB [Pseudothauera lacus]PTD98147.1 tRNA pseudouridine(55) synthase TruB [Pseudothauera lacus]